jgi:hypothetical protein
MDKRELQADVPCVFELLAGCCEAGLSLAGSVWALSKHDDSILTRMFEAALLEAIDTGRVLESLRRIASELDLPDFCHGIDRLVGAEQEGDEAAARETAEELWHRWKSNVREEAEVRPLGGSGQGETDEVMDAQLAEIMSDVAQSLRGGWSFLQAVTSVAQTAPSPWREHFLLLESSVLSGKPVEQPLSEFAHATNSRNAAWMTVAVAVQRQVGSDLARFLIALSDAIRYRQGLQTMPSSSERVEPDREDERK